jgi:cell volume regulation protein A
VDAVDSVNLTLLVVAMTGLLALAASNVARRYGLPAPALFLGLGIAMNAASPDVRNVVDIDWVVRIGALALVLILFEGGFSCGVERMRRSIGPIVGLGLLGTFATTAALALACHHIIGLGWELSVLVGVALAPTDPAAVFSILGNRDVRGRSSAIIEGESGFNDPVSISLMAGAITYVAGTAAGTDIASEFVLSMLVGAAAGIVLGVACGWTLARLQFPHEIVAPFAVILTAFAIYSVTGLLHGSGFLAVLLAGVVMGDHLRMRAGTESLVGLGAALAEIAMFMLLGLTVDLGALGAELWTGIAAFAVLTFVIRPVVVALVLAPTSLQRNERVFIAWGGLRGAVPVLLAALAVSAGADGAASTYAIVFVAVAASIVVQGSTIPWMTRRLRLADEAPA